MLTGGILTAQAAVPQGAMSAIPFVNVAGALVVAFDATTQSAAIASNAVTLCSTQDCWISIGANPTATIGAGSFLLPKGLARTIAITSGHKVAAIKDVTAGNLSILPLAQAT